jgi:type I restriction enzyme M protein
MVVYNKNKIDWDSKKNNNQQLLDLYDRLWEAADELRANSKLRSTQYSTPVLGLLFLRYAFYKYQETKKVLENKFSGRDRQIRPIDYQREGALYLPEKAQYKKILELPESANIGKSIDDAMKLIEESNSELADVLYKDYSNMEDRVLVNLLKLFNPIPVELDHDIFGKIYEFFLGKFAMQEGQGAGEFYTPTSIVKLIVNILEPGEGKILDPACGSGGMFVQSAEFVKNHQHQPHQQISIYGQEKAEDTVRLCKMNLAIHGLSGDVRQGNTYYQDVFDKIGEFDYVMANPPFNVDKVDKKIIKNDLRYPFGIPKPDNANYLWIQLFYSMLNKKGRAGFVMVNSANDAGYSELEIRKRLLEKQVVDVIISISPNFFYTVTLPVTLWFFENGKQTNRDKVLFIDAREVFHQVDRAHREFSDLQVEFISNIARLYRNRPIETGQGSKVMMNDYFPEMEYQDIKGLCKIVSLKDIEEEDWSLNAGRYVGVKVEDIGNQNFDKIIRMTHSQLQKLSEESQYLEKKILNLLEKLSD